jgi:hypothetical protein
MALRFDVGEIRKPYKGHDGTLYADATFARDGILEYRRPDGSTRRELRLPETNQDPSVLTSFGLAPITIEHPSGLVNQDNASDLRKGISLQNVVYEGKGGFVRGQVAILDSYAVDLVESGAKTQLSAGYTCNIEEKPGIWKGIKYDAIQKDVRVNHIALTEKGRAGEAVALHLDSLDDPDVAYQVVTDSEQSELTQTTPPTGKRMANVTIGGVTYEDIPEVFASVVSTRLEDLDSAKSRADSNEQSVIELRDELAQVEEDRDREQGRADAHELCLANAEVLLEEIGYRRDGSGGYVLRDDAGCGTKKDAKMKKSDMNMEEDSEDMEDEEDDEMEEEKPKFPFQKGKKGKMMKKDSAEVVEAVDPKVLAKELAGAWKEADRLVKLDSGSFSEIHFDSADTAADVRRLVVAQLRPELAGRLDSASEGYVDGLYDAISASISDEPEVEETEEDGREDSVTGLSQAIAATRRSSVGSSTGISESAARRMQAYKEPLTLSKGR